MSTRTEVQLQHDCEKGQTFSNDCQKREIQTDMFIKNKEQTERFLSKRNKHDVVFVLWKKDFCKR